MLTPSIRVDKAKCTHCGACIRDCVVGLIEFDGEKIPRYVPGGAGKCVGCQHYMVICPAGALSFGGRDPALSTPAGYGKSEDVLQLIQSRRSVRLYKDQSLPADALQKLVAMLPFIPTGGNRDNLHFTIVRTREKMDALRKAAYAQVMASRDASPFIASAKAAWQQGNDIVFRGATSLVAAAIDLKRTIPGCETADPIIALSYIELYAQSLGLGTVWCDMALTLAKTLPEVGALLEIPENYTLNYVLLLGVPAIRYRRAIQPEMFSVKLLG